VKRIISTLLLFVVLIAAFQGLASADEIRPISVFIDGIMFETDPPATILNGTTYVPLLPLCEVLGAEVNVLENGSDITYVISSEVTNKKLELAYGDDFIKVNGKIVKIAVPPVLNMVWSETKEKVAVVPIKIVMEELGGVVLWDEKGGRIIADSCKPIVFADENLEAAVREIINIPEGEFYKSDVTSVQTLIISEREITSIDGLQYFENLSYLDITKNSITDFTPIMNLKNLTTLLISENPIIDYSPLVKVFNKLKQRDFDIRISIYDQKIKSAVQAKLNKKDSNFSVEDMLQVKELDLSGRGLSDLQGLQFLVNLTDLDLSDNNISNLQHIKSMDGLNRLVLDSNKVESLDYLADLNALEELSLKNNSVTDISVLSKLVSLKKLDLSNNKISSIDSLKNLNGLKELYLSGNYISDFSPASEYYVNLELKDFVADVEIVQRFYIDKKNYYVNDSEKEMDIAPMIKNGRTFLPIRYVTQTLGAVVEWDDIEKKVTVRLSDKKVELWIGKDTARVNGEEVPVGEAPFIYEGRTVLPMRFVGENLDMKVEWNGEEKEVTLFNSSYVRNHPEEFEDILE
jgi:Leucine-rich repeat (LRR) protein